MSNPQARIRANASHSAAPQSDRGHSATAWLWRGFVILLAGAVICLAAFVRENALLGNYRDTESAPAWSPAGNRIAFIGKPGGQSQGDIFSMNVDGRNVRQLTNDAQDEGDPAWSPDGAELAFEAQSVFDPIAIINADGTNRRSLAAKGFSPKWSPDGSRIAFLSGARETNLFVMDLDGSSIRQLTQFPYAGAGYREVYDFSWLPSGERISFLYGYTRFYLVDTDGSNLTSLPIVKGIISFVAWSPDATTIAFFQYADSQRGDIYTMNPDGSNLVRLTHGSLGDGYFRIDGLTWAPDGSRLAYSSYGDIYVMNRDGSNPAKLTGNAPICGLFAITRSFC